MNNAVTIQTRYAKAEWQFLNLAGVDADSGRMRTASDLVYIAEFEIDLAKTGGSTSKPSELRNIQTLIKRCTVLGTA